MQEKLRDSSMLPQVMLSIILITSVIISIIILIIIIIIILTYQSNRMQVAQFSGVWGLRAACNNDQAIRILIKIFIDV